MTGSSMLPPNRFKRALAAGEVQIGFWLGLESPLATEIAAGSGFDWLLLDMEHTGLDTSEVAEHLRAARGSVTELLVRVPSLDVVMVKRLLDLGVRSLMFPAIGDAAQARAAVAATRYPPYGLRGMSGINRANNFARDPQYLRGYVDEQCIVLQIESRPAVMVIDEIGAVDGVDALFIGPNDLAASMGMVGQPAAAEVDAVIADALGRIRATGKAPGVLSFDVERAMKLIASGYRMLAVGSDVALLARRSEELRRRFPAPASSA